MTRTTLSRPWPARLVLIAAVLAVLSAGAHLVAGGQRELEEPAQLGPVRLDVEIESSIRERLESAPGVDATRITIGVENGEVVLEGVIPSYAVRRAMEEEIRNIPGVRSLDNRLSVLPDTAISNRRLEDQVLKALQLNPELAEAHPEVRALAGVVTLSGTVETLWQKERAEELAAQVVGVVEVKDELVVVPPGRPEDEAVAEELAGAIERNREVELEDLEVRVQDGTVYLSGRLPSYSARDRLLEAVRVTDGVIEVVDDTTVVPASPDVYTDRQIELMVRDQLRWDSRVEEENLSVSVSNAVVTLEGTVPSASASRQAVVDARRVPGVRSVENRLVVGHPGADPDDRILAAAIESGLKLNPEVDAEDIEVAVRAGRVVLEGSVDTLRAKLAAEEVVGEAPGVIVLSSRIAVVPTERVQDAAIAEQIVKALHRDPDVRVEDVHVKVEEGSVTLSGIVRSPSARRAAQRAAEDAHGVTGVRNDIIVR